MNLQALLKSALASSTLLATAFVTILLCSTASEAHNRMGHGDPEQMMLRHVDHMAKAADATPEQKTKLAAIANAAQTDIKPLRDQLRANQGRGAALYTAATIDRAAMEQHRAEQFKIMEQISRRRSQARLDSAQVLSAEQRAKLVSKMKQHHERSGQTGVHHSMPIVPVAP
jgi:periplasmic protein CpxP/Spy